MIIGVKVDKVDLNASISESMYKPVIDTEAESIEDVYSIDDLVSEDVLKSLSTEADRIFNDEDENIG